MSDSWSALRVAIVNMWLASRGKPVSRKLVRSLLTSACVYGLTFAVTKLGFKVDENMTALIAQGAALLAGLAAGWLTREFPQIVSDGTAVEVPAADAPVSVPEPAPELRLTVPRPAPAASPAPVTELLKPPAPSSPGAAADADTVTMAAIRDEPAPRRFTGPREVGPRTVV